MNRYLLHCSVLIFFLISCSDDSKPLINFDITEIILSETNSAEFSFQTKELWTIELDGEWFSVRQLRNEDRKVIMRVNTEELNYTNEERIGFIYINLNNGEDGMRHTIKVWQKPFDSTIYYKDGDVVELFSSTEGKGIDLVLMGDGFTLKDLIRKKGKYEKSMALATEHLFSVEPYKTYRNYFNVYMVVAESKEEGVSSEYGRNINTKFSSIYGAGTHISCNYEKCIEYVNLIQSIKGPIVLGDISAVIVLNSEKYAGTCYWWSEGFSIALCPMSNEFVPYDFRGIVNHEVGGHGFAKLADEYIKDENSNLSIPLTDIDNVKWWHNIGHQRNVDFTKDIEHILWRDFIGLPKYLNVGAFEGAYYYSYGVWRPEASSCMINNIPYYNAPSRWLITEKIMKMAGRSLSFDDFLHIDKIEPYHGLIKTNLDMKPLHPPIFVK